MQNLRDIPPPPPPRKRSSDLRVEDLGHKDPGSIQTPVVARGEQWRNETLWRGFRLVTVCRDFDWSVPASQNGEV